jgi:undecaprenol kinase
MAGHKNQPFIHRLRFALTGLSVAWRGEPNFRFQVGMFLAVVVALILLKVEPLWWALVLLTSGLVLAAELFNTALEHLVDHLHPETHPRIAVVKDCAAAAVLMAACAAVLVAVALVVHLITRHQAAGI